MGYLSEAGAFAKTVFEANACVSSVTLTPVSTSISNIEGDKALTEGTPSVINCYIVRQEKKWLFDKAGLIEGGDAIMLVRADQVIKKDYTVQWNNNTYRVQDVLSRDHPAEGVTVYKRCNLFIISSEDSNA